MLLVVLRPSALPPSYRVFLAASSLLFSSSWASYLLRSSSASSAFLLRYNSSSAAIRYFSRSWSSSFILFIRSFSSIFARSSSASRLRWASFLSLAIRCSSFSSSSFFYSMTLRSLSSYSSCLMRSCSWICFLSSSSLAYRSAFFCKSINCFSRSSSSRCLAACSASIFSRISASALRWASSIILALDSSDYLRSAFSRSSWSRAPLLVTSAIRASKSRWRLSFCSYFARSRSASYFYWSSAFLMRSYSYLAYFSWKIFASCNSLAFYCSLSAKFLFSCLRFSISLSFSLNSLSKCSIFFSKNLVFSAWPRLASDGASYFYLCSFSRALMTVYWTSSLIVAL